MQRLLVVLSLLAAAAGPASASTITWGPASDTMGPTAISTTGTLLKAFDSGGAGATVNGVTFAAGETAGDDVIFPRSPYSSYFYAFDDNADLGDVGLDALLRTGAYAQPIGGPGTEAISISGLSIGTQYELQFFFMDQRGSYNSPPQGCRGCNDRTVTFSSGSNSVTLDADPDNDSSAAPFGQFVIGYFTADATSQGFDISGSVVQQVNAWQVRAIPEPETYALSLLGLAGVRFLVRRRKAASA
jgi:hypothetical protein